MSLVYVKCSLVLVAGVFFDFTFTLSPESVSIWKCIFTGIPGIARSSRGAGGLKNISRLQILVMVRL